MTFCQNFENFGVALGIYDEKSSDFSSRKQFVFNILRWKQKKIPAELKKRCWKNYFLFRNVNFGRRRREKIRFWKVSKENCFFISTFGYIWRFGNFWKFWRNFGYIYDVTQCVKAMRINQTALRYLFAFKSGQLHLPNPLLASDNP